MVLKFLKNTSILFCAVTIFTVVYLIIYQNQIRKITISKNINVVVCGDSHTQTAINDSKLINVLNISQNSEPYLATYNIIKTLTKNNTQIKTIVLGYSFHSLSNIFDEIIYKEKHKVDFYSRYLPILDFESISLISKKNIFGLIESFPKSLNTWITIKNLINSNDINFNDYKFFGEYYPSKKSSFNIKTVNTTIDKHYFIKKKVRQFSKIQISYLIKISSFCEKNKIKLILLNTPISKLYYNKVPARFKNKYYSTLCKINKKSILLDLSNLNIKDQYFGDGDHLNIYGAELLNSKLKKLSLKILK